MKIIQSPFYCEPLTSRIHNKRDIQSFTIDREEKYRSLETIVGLEAYLKRCAWDDDKDGYVRIYLVKEVLTNAIVAYFGLKAGELCVGDSNDFHVDKATGEKHTREVIPAVEISHFAVNDEYRRKREQKGKPINRLGELIFPAFIEEIIQRAKDMIGVKIVYLFAAGDEPLQRYYQERFGFSKRILDDEIVPMIPNYDNGCVFMYKTI